MASRSAQRLFVTNLPWTVSHRELRQYFEEFGRVYASKVIFDKQTGLSRRYGFVEIQKTSLANVENRQSHVLEGNRLQIQRSN